MVSLIIIFLGWVGRMCTTHFSSPSPPPSSDPISSQHQHTEWLKPLRVHASPQKSTTPPPSPELTPCAHPEPPLPLYSTVEQPPIESPPTLAGALHTRRARSPRGCQSDRSGRRCHTHGLHTPFFPKLHHPQNKHNKLHCLMPSMAVLLINTAVNLFVQFRVAEGRQ